MDVEVVEELKQQPTMDGSSTGTSKGEMRNLQL